MRGKVLLACQNEDCSDRLFDIFREMDLSMVVLNDEADFLLSILEEDFDAVFFDLELPDAHGLKTVKIVRRIRPKLPLIVLTQECNPELGGKVMQEGVAYFGDKLINQEAIRNTLNKLLN